MDRTGLYKNEQAMTTIGIFGASSQVGSSVALYLKKFPGIKTVCFIRSSYSQVFFELLDIDFQYIDFNNETELKEKIGSLDVILDFGYPAGQLHDILSLSKNNIGKTMQAMKSGGIYFYMSSIMAYGMPDNEKWIHNYTIPRTSYAYIKRSIEKFTSNTGRKTGIKIYNFRLGQVHGFLQSVNGSFRKKLADSNIALIDGEPCTPVNIIFIYPLCEAIIKCIEGIHPPGLYTLVSHPQWTLKELYEYYNQQAYHANTDLEFSPADAVKKNSRSLFQRGIDLVRPWRSMVETYILMKFPALTIAIKGRFRQNELLNQTKRVNAKLEYIDFNLLGSPSFPVIPGLTTAPDKMLTIETETEAYYHSMITAAYK
jgi:nucleoside-diphosphate-sugar epimerase